MCKGPNEKACKKNWIKVFHKKKMEEQIQQDLVDMGFSEIRAKKAVFFTGNKGISEALDW